MGGGTRPTVGRPPRCRAGGPRRLVGVWAWRFGVGEWALGDIGAYFGGVPKGPCGRRGVRGEGSLWPLCFAEFQSYLLEDKTQQSQLKDLTGFTLRLQRAGSCSRDGHKTPGRRGRQGSHPGPDAGSTPRSVAFRGCRGLWAGGATRLSSLPADGPRPRFWEPPRLPPGRCWPLAAHVSLMINIHTRKCFSEFCEML